MKDSIANCDGTGWHFDNTYSQLPNHFFEQTNPAKVRSPRVEILNHRLAAELGLNFHALSPEELAALFAGQSLPTGSYPIAQAYAGHQFGGFTMLGDGRAILLGEHRTPAGQLMDIQFKGSGRTKFSRGGDGLATLGPMLREYVISEAMSSLGIPTTRSLAVVTTGDQVYRTSPLKGSILTRVARSHIRVGTFQYIAALNDVSNLRRLADYAVERHYPNIIHAQGKYLEFFRAVMDRQASLIAQWQLVGFIHGVMNTDNVAISGETIDYGPCAFMNAYNPNTVFSSIDQAGRYAYGNQPMIGQWNLARFAETLLPILDSDQENAVTIAMEVLNEFPLQFEKYWLAGMRKKLGFHTNESGDIELVQTLLQWMQESKADFTNTFRSLSQHDPSAMEQYREPKFSAWFSQWKSRLSREERDIESAFITMQAVNPAVIPRNHRVEEALSHAEKHDDLTMLHRLLTVLDSPYKSGSDIAFYQEPPPQDCGYQTFCGT